MSTDIVVVDSVTALDAQHADTVLVCGSHGGLIAARYAIAGRIRAAIFNDAGVGLDHAGVAGLGVLESLGIAAAAVSHMSARIGDGSDTLHSGIVSYATAMAKRCGVRAGLSCREAAEALRNAPTWSASLPPLIEGRHLLRKGDGSHPAVLGIDSIGLVERSDERTILVIGSHGGLHGGDAGTALPVDAFAAFFHDAGRGKEDAGLTRLPVLARRGISAGAVDYRTARIGDARSLWGTGRLSSANAPMRARGIHDGMTVRTCVAILLSTDQTT